MKKQKIIYLHCFIEQMQKRKKTTPLNIGYKKYETIRTTLFV
jgi:hypothetical protein